MDKFNDTDIMVLGVILKHGKENGASLNNGIVIDDILHVIKDKSIARIRNSIKLLLSYCYITEGVKVGRKKTYVINEKGIEFLKDIKKNIINVN